MKKIQVSKKDVKLLIILLSLIILYVTYQFVYTKNMNQTEQINTKVTTLQKRLSELKIKVDQGDAIRTENDSMLKEIDSIEASYGNGATQEKSIMMVNNLEAVADMSISTAAFSEPVYFFYGTNTVEGQTDTTALDAASAELDTATGKDADSSVNQTTVDATQLNALDNMSGYRSTISITFSVSYEGFKKCVDYINNYSEKSNVGDVSLSYDSETGMLSGTMNINMYHLTGEEIKYQAPVIGSMEIGMKNIFGTLDIPAKDKK